MKTLQSGYAFSRFALMALLVSLAVLLPSSSTKLSAQSYDMTMEVLVNSANTTGYNPSASAPGEYQRYLERYLEHLQIPYRVVDTATEEPPANLGTMQLIVAGHTGLALSAAWQQAILLAVQGGSGFVNFDADPSIGLNTHIQGIFGATGSYVGPTGTVIDIPSAVMPDGANPHYIAAMQLRFQDTPAGDITYPFHEDANDVQQVATPTLLRGAQGTTIALIGNSPLILATQTGGGRAVDFTTYDFMHADRFGFMQGIDDLIWRSLVWAARKPFVLRGYPRFYAPQMDDEVVGWGARLRDLWDPTLTGSATSTGTGGPWKVTAMAQLVNLTPGGQDRADAIADVNGGNLKIAFHTNTGISEGDFYWNPQSAIPLTDAQWQANLAFGVQIMQGNGGSDTLPPLSKSMVPHFWNLSNNVGWDLWNTLGVRYITEIQQPGAYYNYGPPKTSAMRLWTHPFRVYELPPTGTNPNELYTLYSADFLNVGSTAGLPPVTFFTFTTQLLGNRYPSFDARWPNDNQAVSVQESVNNFTEYAWRFWSGMAPVQMYNHDGGSFEISTETERQQAITQISTFLNNKGVQHVFMENLGAYMCARVSSVLSTATASPTSLNLNFTGNATDMDGNLVPTNVYVFYGDNEGIQQTVPGFTGGYSYSTPNAAPPAIGLSAPNLIFAALPGTAPVTQTLTVNNTGSGILNYSVSSNAPWLTASAGTGTAPDTLTVTADPSQLSAGAYSGLVQVNSPGALNNPQSINVTFAVMGATLAAAPASLSFSGYAGAANPAAQQLTISNVGAGVMDWSASTPASWLQVSASSGYASSGSPATLTVNVNTTGLAPGTYTTSITVTSLEAVNGSPQTIPVTLTVTGILMQAAFPGPTLDGWAYSPMGNASGWSISNNILSYSGIGATQLYAGNASWSNYTAQASFQLSSLLDYPGGLRAYVNPATGASYTVWLYPNEGVLKLWRTSVWNINSNAVLLGTSPHLSLDSVNWHTLALSMNNGRIVASLDGTTEITVTDTTLGAGLIALDVSNKPIQFQSVQVTGNQTITTQIQPSVASLTFNVMAGNKSTAQAIALGTSDGATVAWSALPSLTSILASPATGSSSGPISVQADATQLSVGTYNGQIELTSYGALNVSTAIPVTINVTQPSTNQLTITPASLTFYATAGGATPANQNLSLSSTTSGLGYTVSSDSAWLSAISSGATPGSITVSINQSTMNAGAYTGHLTITAPAATVASTVIPVTLNLSQTPTIELMNTNFSDSMLDGWAYSPMGLAANWSLANSVLSYNGGGATQLYAGNGSWTNYTVQSTVKLSSMTDYPGGIRGYVNPATGASYAAWIYPAEGLVKLYRTSVWNINTSPVLLGTSAHLTMDATNWHTLALALGNGQVVALYDGVAVAQAADANLTSGMVALDVSNKAIQFSNVLVMGTQAMSTQLATSQPALAFAVPSGSTSASQTLQITSNDGTVAAWSTLGAPSWLTISAATGQTSGSSKLQVNAAALAAGSYSGTLNLASFGAANTPIAVPITLTVTTPSTNQVSLSPTSLSFTAVSGGLAPAAQTVTVSSTVAGLASTITSDSSWLTATASGTTPFQVQVSANSIGMSSGAYTGHLTISTPGAMNPAITLTATLSVTNPTLVAAPATLSFVGSTTTNAPTQNLQITNSSGAAGWSAAATTTWPQLSAAAGTTPSTLQIGAVSAGLAAGSYSDVLTFTPAVSGTALQVPVALRVGSLLFSDNFASSAQWTASPMGLAANWSVSANSFNYNGGGATQQYAGLASWTNYTFQADVRLSNASNYPGGIRVRLNPATGAAYAVWLYPAASQVKLLKSSVWNMNTNPTTLVTASKVNLPAGTHHLRVDVQGSAITVYVDYAQVIATTDSSFAAGAIALDVSNQPVSYSNISVVSF